MKTLVRLVTEYKENNNLIPYKTIKLPTGVVCDHYKNGNILVR